MIVRNVFNVRIRQINISQDIQDTILTLEQLQILQA